jgi:hypothetical protein
MQSAKYKSQKLVHGKMLWVICLEGAMMNRDKIQAVTTEKATEYHGYNNEYLIT